ncbi:MAG TPA: DUF4097 family beta strand repeat-containing protein [Chryseosolibacter sp.]|nr:DUF4097 family beta strand repeat-containing protein [Chryseosolibacter sp.]
MNKKLLIIGIVLVSLGLILISNSIVRAQSSQFTVPLSDPAKRGKLKVHLNVGSINITGTARKDVLIKYSSDEDDEEMSERDGKNQNKNKNRNDNEDSDSRAGLRRIGGGGMDLQVTENGNTVVVQSGSWSHGLNLDLEIPSGMDLEIHTYNDGDLMVSNVQGEVALSNYNGDITARNISGSVVASTYNGEIKSTFDKVTENTPMSFSTFNGDIDLTFPATLKATLKMKTEQGEIFSGFDVNITSSGPVQMKDTKGGVYKVVIDDWKTGQINGGGPEITMKNYHGDILIRKR